MKRIGLLLLAVVLAFSWGIDRAAAQSLMYADFGGSGIWQWDGAAWSNPTGADPENMVASKSTLYADYGASGLWMWNGIAWLQLSPANPETLVVSGSMLYADYGASGLWIWNGTAWRCVSAANPENMVADTTGPQGLPGTVGYACWDFDGSGLCEIGTEDTNEDGICSITDCRMPIIKSGANYSCGSLANSNFSYVVLSGADFRGADLRLVDFSFADCRGAYLGESPSINLCGGRVSDLTGANFSGANLYLANFTNAKRVGTIWSNTICPDGTRSDTNGTSPESCEGHGM